MLSFLGGAPFAQDLETAFAKISEALPARSLPYLERIQELFSARPDPWKDYSAKQDVIAGLIDAILHQRQARIAYYSFNSKRTKDYTLDPYRLVYYRGGLYLYARAHEYDEVRTFAVERVQKMEVLDEGFEVPSDFNPSEYARSAFGISGGEARDGGAPVPPGHGRATSASARGTRASGSRTSPTARSASPWRWPPASSSRPGSRASCPTSQVVRPAALREEIARELDEAALPDFEAR